MASKPNVDWLNIVDVGQAVKNVLSDTFGDWHRDPWGWPELELIRRRPEVVADRLASKLVSRTTNIDVAKEQFGARPAIVMDIVDRVAYQAIVDRISNDLIGQLPATAFGWRLNATEPIRGHYANNGEQHSAYRSHISKYGSHPDIAGLKTDIVSFFANVEVDSLLEQVRSATSGGLPLDRLELYLRAWDSQPDRFGIPQRFQASAVLANFYLQPLDDYILEPVSEFRGRRKSEDELRYFSRQLDHILKGQSARWMDDIWVFRSDEGSLRTIQLGIQDILRQLGLDMNIAKTDVLTGEALKREVLELQHSAVDDALIDLEPDTGPLDELLDQLFARPEIASRTSLSFALKRMRAYGHSRPLDELVNAAERAPHAADKFARLFRDSGMYRDLHSWFLRYWNGDWATFDWSTAQLGTMFPQNRVRKRLADAFAESLDSNVDISIKTLAAQRLSASKEPAKYRDAIRQGVKTSTTPLERRNLCIAAVACGMDRKFVRSSLSEFEENSVLLKLLEESNFRAITPTADFSGLDQQGP